MNKQKTLLDHKYINTQELRQQVKKVKKLSNKLQELRPSEALTEPELISSNIIEKFPESAGKSLRNLRMEISTENQDCLVVAGKLLRLNNNCKILIMNLANRKVAGGGWEKGAMAQEESIFYRTNYFQSLYLACHLGSDERYYYNSPVAHGTAYYTENVTMLYDENYQELTESDRIKFDMLAIAGYDLGRNRHQPNPTDLEKLDETDLKEKNLLQAYQTDLQNNDQKFTKLAEIFKQYTKEKILLILQAAH